jgi:hypothetical protein
MPPMPPRVATIKRAIESRQDFSVLADGGEAAVRTWAKEHGMNGCALIIQWQANYRQQQAQAERVARQKKTLPQKPAEGFPERDIAALHDLDFWPDDWSAAPSRRAEPLPKRTPPPLSDDDNDDDGDQETGPQPPDDPDDNDVGPVPTTKTCPQCHGRGRDHSGLSCPNCGGSGRVPVDDVGDGDDDDTGDEMDKKSYEYEFEEE